MNTTQEPYSDQVFHRYLSLQRHTRQYGRQLLDDSGLTQRNFSVMCYLLEAKSATVGQIQTFIHKSPSTTSALISQLEEKGYVTRTRPKEDNRIVIVELTPIGREITENTPLGGLPLLRRRLSKLSIKRLEEIDGVFQEIMHLMDITET